MRDAVGQEYFCDPLPPGEAKGLSYVLMVFRNGCHTHRGVDQCGP